MSHEIYTVQSEPVLLSPTRCFELHKWRKTTIEGSPALEPPKSVRAEAMKISWLSLAASTYNVSRDPRDYVVSEVPLVTADVPNRNKDAFPFVSLTTWNPTVGRVTYETFIGKPAFVEHDNQEPLNARGVNFDTSFGQETTASGVNIWKVRVLTGFDRTKDRELAKSIAAGDRRAYSMGAMVDRFTCSVCNGFTNSKGEPLSSKSPCRCVGLRKGSIVAGVLKYNLCWGVNFIENSSVKVGADHTAVSDEWWT